MLDINLFREDKGHNPEIIRESQRRRFANVDIVDEVIQLDKEWRQRNFIFFTWTPFFHSIYYTWFISSYGNVVCLSIGQYELDNLRKDFNRINKEVARLKIVSLFG